MGCDLERPKYDMIWNCSFWLIDRDAVSIGGPGGARNTPSAPVKELFDALLALLRFGRGGGSSGGYGSLRRDFVLALVLRELPVFDEQI